MINPCTKDCPDRKPGCECEKRKAWKWNQQQIKEAQKKENIVKNYRREKINSSRKTHKRYRWDQ